MRIEWLLVILYMFYSLFIIGCDATAKEPAILHLLTEEEVDGYTLVKPEEHYSVIEFANEIDGHAGDHILSRADTQKLKELLDAENGWEESEPCECIGACELIIEDTRYVIDVFDREHQIMYGPIESDLTGAISNSDIDVVKEVYYTLINWLWMGSSYECFYEEYAKKEGQATLIEYNNDKAENIVLSEKDASRLRTLLDIDSGWMENPLCDCIGDYQLTLDNIRYVIDITDENHQIKYGVLGGELTEAIENEDKDVVREIYEIIGQYYN